MNLALSTGLPFALCAFADIQEADQLLIDNRFKQAEDAYRELIDADQTGDCYAGLAVALAKQNLPSKVQESERILRQARDQFSDNPNVIAAGGYVSYIHSKTVASPAKRDQYLEAAENLCKRALKVNPDILIAQQTLGQVCMAEDDNDSAVEPLRKAVSLAETPINLTLLAQALLRLDPKDREAEELVSKALSLNANYWPARLEKAVVLAGQGKNEDGFMEMHNIPEKERTADWYQIEGDIYRKQGDGTAAIASWHEAIRLDAHTTEAYRHLAEYYALRGDGELAINEMHNALEILPNDMPLRLRLAELALRQDKLDVAEQEYNTILASNPDDPSALLGLSRVGFRKYRRDGHYPPGWQELTDKLESIQTEESVKGQVLKAGTKQLQDTIQLSEAEKSLAQNHFRDARKFFTSVISSHKEDPYELLTLGEQAFNDGDLRSAEEAFTYAKEIPEIAPRAEQGISKITTQRTEAERQTKLGDATWRIPEVAIDHYKQALHADPQSSSAYYGLFNLFSKIDKEPDMAISNGLCFLEAADDNNPLRGEVESNLVKLKRRIGRSKGK